MPHVLFIQFLVLLKKAHLLIVTGTGSDCRTMMTQIMVKFTIQTADTDNQINNESGVNILHSSYWQFTRINLFLNLNNS